MNPFRARRLSPTSILVVLLATFGITSVVVLATSNHRSISQLQESRFLQAFEYHTRDISRSIEASLTTFDVVIRTAVERLESNPDSHADLGYTSTFQSMLNSFSQQVPALRTVVVVDPGGTITSDTRAGAPAVGLNVGDRDYFTIHTRTEDRGPFVSVPVRSRVDGTWIWTISRAARAADGKLLGVVVASLESASLEQLAGRHHIMEEVDSVFLIDSDSVILSTFSSTAQRIGTRLDVHGLVMKAENYSVDDYNVRFENESNNKFFTISAIASFPLRLVTISRPGVLSNALQFGTRWLILWTVLCIVLVISAIALQLLHSRRLKSALDESSSRERFLEYAGQLANVGGWSVEIPSNRLTWTPETYRIHDLPVDQAITVEQAIGYYDVSDRALVSRNFEHAIGSGRRLSFEARICTSNGLRKWVRVVGDPVVEGDQAVRVAGAMMDITRFKDVETEIKSTQHSYESLFEASPSAIIDLDGNGIVRLANKAALSLLSHEEVEQLLGTPLISHLPLADPERFDRYLSHARLGEPGHFECDGSGSASERTFSISLVPVLDADGQMTNILATIGDITDEIREAENLRRSQTMSAVGQMASGLAHDFNNILGIISGNLRLIERDSGEDVKLGDRARVAMSAVERAARLTGKLLGFTHDKPYQPELVDINEAIGEMRSLIERSVTPNVSIEYRLAEQPLFAIIDQGDLETAVINLVLNARDAMPAGGGITIETATGGGTSPVRSVGEPGSAIGAVEIRVRDRGTGIDPTIVDRIFEPFFTTKPLGKGTGLGLAMVHGFCTRSGGHATVDSNPGDGTTIALSLPRAEPPAPSSTGEQSSDGNRSPTIELPAARGHRVLAVDDEVELLDLVASALRDEGFDVLTAHSGAEALEVLEREAPPEILFTDILMPGGMDGHHLAALALARVPGLRIVFSSGHSAQNRADLDPRIATAPLVRKPYSIDDVCETLRALFLKPAPQADHAPSAPAECGLEAIDDDHRQLSRILEKLRRSLATDDPKQFSEILSTVEDYSKHHFRTEEMVLYAIGFEELEQHREDHDRIETEIEDLRRSFELGREMQVDRLGNLADSLHNHIETVDRRYYAYLQRAELMAVARRAVAQAD